MIDNYERPLPTEEREELRDELEVEHAMLLVKKLRGEATREELNALSKALAWNYVGDRRWKIELGNDRAICNICGEGASWSYTGVVQCWHDGKWFTQDDWVGHEDCIKEELRDEIDDFLDGIGKYNVVFASTGEIVPGGANRDYHDAIVLVDEWRSDAFETVMLPA